MQPSSEQDDNTTPRDFRRIADSPVATEGDAGSPPLPSQTEGQALCLLSAMEMTRASPESAEAISGVISTPSRIASR